MPKTQTTNSKSTTKKKSANAFEISDVIGAWVSFKVFLVANFQFARSVKYRAILFASVCTMFNVTTIVTSLLQ